MITFQPYCLTYITWQVQLYKVSGLADVMATLLHLLESQQGRVKTKG